MKEFTLYLESGPKHRKTMVHVLDLLGCVIRGATTDEALVSTPAGIRSYLMFLQSSGESVELDFPFTTRVAAHVTEGDWLGEGDPTQGFAPDFEPLSPRDLQLYLDRLQAIHASQLDLVKPLTPRQLSAEPADGHRSLFRIIDHAAESDYNYLRMQIGSCKEIVLAKKAITSTNIDLPGALNQYWQLIADRLAAFTAADLARLVPHGQITWSAHRTMRRLLEHNWEHREEIRTRLESPANCS